MIKMSNDKRIIPIRIAFFKGFAGMILSVLLYYLTIQIAIIVILVDPNDPILDLMETLNNIAEFTILVTPLYYWVIYPLIALALYYEEYDISNW